jgi:hypothetical protein
MMLERPSKVNVQIVDALHDDDTVISLECVARARDLKLDVYGIVTTAMLSRDLSVRRLAADELGKMGKLSSREFDATLELREAEVDVVIRTGGRRDDRSLNLSSPQGDRRERLGDDQFAGLEVRVPRSAAETIPKVGDKLLFLLQRQGTHPAEVIKVLLPTDENIRSCTQRERGANGAGS